MKVRVNSAEVITRQYKRGKRAGQNYKYVLFHLGPVSKYMAASDMNETFYRMFSPAIVDTWDAIPGTVDPNSPNRKTITATQVTEALTQGLISQEDLTLGTTIPMNTELDIVTMPLEGKWQRHDGEGNIVMTADGTPVEVTSVQLVLMKIYDATLDGENKWRYAPSDQPQDRLDWLLETFYTPVGTSANATVEAPAAAAPSASPSPAAAAAAPAPQV